MEFLQKHLSNAEGIIGSGLILGVSYLTWKTGKISRYLLKNYDSLYKTKIDLKTLIKNPGKEQHLIINNLATMPTPQLFKQHMSLVDRDIIASKNQFCFKQPAPNFMAQIPNKNDKYDVYCDCSTFDPFVSSPLLINNYDLLKQIGKKQKLTMICYGCIKYDSQHNRFNFEGHSFGTTQEQIQWAWKKILTSKSFYFLIEGIFLGIGCSLIWQKADDENKGDEGKARE